MLQEIALEHNQLSWIANSIWGIAVSLAAPSSPPCSGDVGQSCSGDIGHAWQNPWIPRTPFGVPNLTESVDERLESGEPFVVIRC